MTFADGVAFILNDCIGGDVHLTIFERCSERHTFSTTFCIFKISKDAIPFSLLSVEYPEGGDATAGTVLDTTLTNGWAFENEPIVCCVAAARAAKFKLINCVACSKSDGKRISHYCRCWRFFPNLLLHGFLRLGRLLLAPELTKRLIARQLSLGHCPHPWWLNSFNIATCRQQALKDSDANDAMGGLGEHHLGSQGLCTCVR